MATQHAPDGEGGLDVGGSAKLQRPQAIFVQLRGNEVWNGDVVHVCRVAVVAFSK